MTTDRNWDGEKIRHFRKERGYSQYRLAQKIDYTRSTLSGWERGRNKPPRHAIEQISEVLDVPTIRFR